MAKIMIPEGYTPEDVTRGLKLLEQVRVQRERSRARQDQPEVKARQKERNRKAHIETALYVSKAKAAGITVSADEVARIYQARLPE